MRVLFLSHDFLPAHATGTEIYAGTLAVRLRERGHDVRVFTTEKDIGRPHRELARREWQGVPVYELVNNLFYEDFRETWDWPPAVEALRGVLDEFRPDVVHVMHLLYLSIGCVEEAHARGIPVVYTLHDFWLQCARFGQRIHADGDVCHTIDFARCGTCLVSLKFAQTPSQERAARWISGVRRATGVNLAGAARGAQRILARRGAVNEYRSPAPAEAARMETAVAARDRALRERLVPRVRRFFAPSRFLRERYVEWGVPAERIEHLTYGLELEPFAGFQRSPSELVRVAFLGTLAPHKAPHVPVEAWGRLPDELRTRGRLTIYGPPTHNPEYVASLERRAREVGAELAGGVSRAEIPRTFAEIDLLVVSSVWYENSPLTIHEALATRTPLLVSDLGGMAELVQPGSSGFRFPAGDAGALAEELARILREPERLAGLDFGAAPVKDMRTSAEEMEARYAQVCE